MLHLQQSIFVQFIAIKNDDNADNVDNTDQVTIVTMLESLKKPPTTSLSLSPWNVLL